MPVYCIQSYKHSLFNNLEQLTWTCYSCILVFVWSNDSDVCVDMMQLVHTMRILYSFVDVINSIMMPRGKGGGKGRRVEPVRSYKLGDLYENITKLYTIYRK